MKYCNHNPKKFSFSTLSSCTMPEQMRNHPKAEWWFIIFYKWEKNIKEEEIKALPPKLIKSMAIFTAFTKSRVLNFLIWGVHFQGDCQGQEELSGFSLPWPMNSSPSIGISFSFIAFWREKTRYKGQYDAYWLCCLLAMLLSGYVTLSKLFLSANAIRITGITLRMV